jgi:hypothetical protein
MDRIEYKYLMRKEDTPRLRSLLKPCTVLDKFSEIMPNKEYTVRSIYLDSASFEYYHEKISGIRLRRKLRIRGYNEQTPDSYVFLEIKRKNGPAIYKHRAKVSFQNLPALMCTGNVDAYVSANGTSSKTREDAQRFFYQIYKRNLRPVVLINYEREAFFYKFDEGWRVTIDKNLRSTRNFTLEGLYKELNIIRMMPHHYILEIKGTGVMPHCFREIAGILKVKLMAISKYTNSIDAHNNKFGHFYRDMKYDSAEYRLKRFNEIKELTA